MNQEDTTRTLMENEGIRSKWGNWGIILTIYIALKPIYLNASGSLQICDIFMLVGLLYIIICMRGKIIISRQFLPILISLSSFVLYICVINGLWSITGYNYSRYSLFYIFNFLAFLMCLFIYSKVGRIRFTESILNGAFLSGIISLVGTIQSIGNIRSLGFFNNPNQLGYYGVILVSLVFACKNERYRIKGILIMAMGIWCVIVSMSKAAFLSMMIQCILCVIFLGNNKSKKDILKKIVLILGLGTLIYLFVYTDILSISIDPLARLKRRLYNMSTENDTTLGSGRGYDRILELGPHIFWGMGEGNFTRFTVASGAEVHSTYASLIVSYGLFGFALYCVFLWKILIQRGVVALKNVAISTGMLLYSISHNGIRNTLVWILFAVLFFCPLTSKHNV